MHTTGNNAQAQSQTPYKRLDIAWHVVCPHPPLLSSPAAKAKHLPITEAGCTSLQSQNKLNPGDRDSHQSHRTRRHASQPSWAADTVSSPTETEAEALPAAPAATAGAAEDRAAGGAAAQPHEVPAGATLFEAKDFSLVMPPGFVDAQPPPPPTSGFGAPVRTTLGEPQIHTLPMGLPRTSFRS